MSFKNHPWGIFIICWFTGMCAGMDANLFSILLMPTMSDLSPQHAADKMMLSQIGSYILSLFLMGWAIGGITIGIASDFLGRVRAMAGAVLIFSLFSAFAACSESTAHFAVCRFFMGLGLGGAMVNMSVLLAESWPSRTRANAIGSLLTSYQAGVFASGMLVHIIPSWRYAFAAAASPLLLSAIILYVIPEKPRQIHALVAMRALQERGSLLKGSFLFGSLLVAYWASASWIPTWIQDLKGATSGDEKSFATMWHGVAAIGGCLLAGPLVIFLGRIRTLMLAFFTAFVLTLSIVWLHQEFSLWLYVNYAFLGIAIGIAQATLYIYLPELFSSMNRGRNVGICLNIGRVFTAIAVLLGSVLIPLLEGYANGIVLFAWAYPIGIGAAFMCKETIGQELPA